MLESPPPLRVLVVDDEKSIADSLALIARTRGHDARVAYSAEEALDLANEFHPQAVISDVVMPGMSGIDLAVHFATDHPECRVLLVSGNAVGFGLVEESARRGHSLSILAKPVHPARILEFLATCAPVPS